MFSRDKIQIGISSCLLGQEVRHNGGHKRNAYISETLSTWFTFLPFCPEVAIGLGVPRPTIRLTGERTAPRAVMPAAENRDVTEDLEGYGRATAQAYSFISGYIFKAKSPSCGMERVRLFDEQGELTGASSGIFARAIMRALPLLPVEEEGRLNDPDLRDSFIQRVFAYHRWQVMSMEGITPAAMVAYHTEHKFLIMAHDQDAMRRLGRLVAGIHKDPERLSRDYLEILMTALKKPASRKNRSNVLNHIAGFFKDKLDSADRMELAESIDAYRRDELPLIAPLTLIRHHLRRNPHAYVENQRFLESKD